MKRRIGQALVPDVNDRERRRWTVMLVLPGLMSAKTIEHYSGEPDPEKALTEAIRKHVPNGESFAPVLTETPADRLLGIHPAVVRDSDGKGWARFHVFTAAGIQLPGEVQVHLLAYGGARDTGIEHTDDPHDLDLDDDDDDDAPKFVT